MTGLMTEVRGGRGSTIPALVLALVFGLAGGVEARESETSWVFGYGEGRDGGGGFVVGNTSLTNGEWSVEEGALRFINRYRGADSDQNNFTEAAAVVDLSEHGFVPGDDFTVSVQFELRGVRDWSRVGVVGLAPDMENHKYRETGFYHGQLRVHSGGGYHLRVADGFSGDRPIVSLPMKGSIREDAYQMTLIGTYTEGEKLVLRIEFEREDESWIMETEEIAAPLEGTWFGFGGRFRAHSGSEPRVDIKRFHYAPRAAELPVVEEDPLQFEGYWSAGAEEIPYRVTVRRAAHRYRPLDTVIYLRNLNVPRIGTESDVVIIDDLLDMGHAVVEVDCGSLPGTYPELPEALMEFNDGVVERISKLSGGVVVPDIGNLYWLPSGYRLERNVPFWNLEKHAAPGTFERIVQTWNSHVVERAGVPPIESPEELRGPGGEDLDYHLYMDIMYPSGNPATPVPVIAHFSTLSVLARAFREERAIYPLTWLSSGYAVVYVDHIYNPLARARYYGHFGPYSLQSSNGIAAGSAAVRFLRTHADQYNFSESVGALGHSKSSYTVVRLADPRHPEQSEWTVYDGPPSPAREPQPWEGVSSEIQVAYASMGDGTRRTGLFNSHMVPFFTAAGLHDRYDEWRRFPALVSVCEQEDLHHHALWMEDLGHTYPMGTDLASGRNRTAMVKSFFDQHLHPGGSPDDLEVLGMIPADGNEEVDTNGVSRFIRVEDDDLPVDMYGLSPEMPVSVVFARRVDPDTLDRRTLVLRSSSGTRVSGEWLPSLQNTRFQFHPEESLKPNASYEIVVRPGVRDELGTTLADEVRQEFRTKP